MLLEASETAAEALRSSGQVTIVSHIDADGLCSAAVATSALTAADVDHEVRFVKNLSSDEVAELRDEGHEMVWFVDLGSGMADELEDTNWVISDHHTPKGRGPEHHLNPHFHGIDGSREVSGAGMSWAVARHLVDDDRAAHLARLAVVGAVGDLQNRDNRRLKGVNRSLVALAAEAGELTPLRDMFLFGRETRPIHRFFQYADEPSIPGVSGSAVGASQFLVEHSVPRREPGNGERSWVHLDHEERRRLASGAARRIVAGGHGPATAMRLFGEVYELGGEEPGTAPHEAKEFATLLNSTARYDRADVGLALALGDRGAAMQEAEGLIKGHRRSLVQGVEYVVTQGLEHQGNLQWFHGHDRIRDTIVGIVAGMVSKRPVARRDAVIVGFANASDEEVKVSCRSPRPLVARGIDLAEAVAHAAKAVGGEGGGHKGAAGATIPAGREAQFLDQLDAVLSTQLGSWF